MNTMTGNRSPSMWTALSEQSWPTWEMNPVAFNGIFMIARTPGLVARVIEEQTREKPMRRIDPVKHGYDGPAHRKISK
jgi:citrate synthase